MSDRYLTLINSPFGRTVATRVGLPRPGVLRRYQLGDPVLEGPLRLGRVGADGIKGLPELLTGVGLGLVEGDSEVVSQDRDASCGVGSVSTRETGRQRWSGLVFDASAASRPGELAELRDFFAGALRRLAPAGRVVVIGRQPQGQDPVLDATRNALDGIIRSLAKELRAGATANLVLLTGDADAAALEGPLRFLLSGRSAYVDGQVLVVGALADESGVADWNQPLAGRVAVVTGAARGIGAAIAAALARDGARVIAADLPAAGEALSKVANQVGGTALQLDIAAPQAAGRLIQHAETRYGGLDLVIHNAGITRDKLLANMSVKHWDSVLAVNLEAQLLLNRALLDSGLLRAGHRLVSLASTSGIAGNRGQTNYAASKAGVIGMVRSWSSEVAAQGGTINAVAPGFIDTDMTHAMPFATREVARRLNSLQQAGLPVDVAEAVGFLCWPASSGVNGQVLRVCGQNLVGA
ncbi:3-oxoacyl-ACP reductase [Jatrophihabitans telluris]|uniref:3-oxoacyl-ACP reductase n=1 Tax=Jatrophihabitans telluris TaxID=2038343 RepID=A0ABY4R053_9ACTN|nr:3-oxoacyl-ACP reductase [Jatrophihabitans telluris]UQX88837.1 3-oxoacyl-ACP reductase [Jatrophihabitans telluris]